MLARVNFCLLLPPPRDSRQRYAPRRAKPHLNFVISPVSIVSSSWETLSPALSARIRSAVYAKATLCPIHMPRHVSPFLCVLRPDPARTTASSLSPPRIGYASRSTRFHPPRIPHFCRIGTRQEIEIQTLGRRGGGIMGRFRLKTSSGNFSFRRILLGGSIDHLLETGMRTWKRDFSWCPDSKASVTLCFKGCLAPKQAENDHELRTFFNARNT